jgi:hypothetical protein
MMSQHQLYDFVYEKLSENLDRFEVDMIHPDKDIMFSIDKENVRLYIQVGHEKADVDTIWQIGIERYRDVEGEPEENAVAFKEKFIKHMKEVEDHFKHIEELDFFNDGLNEFLMTTF